MSYLTRPPGVPDTDDVKPGMAHFAGTGPYGATCGTCRFRGYWRPTKDKVDPRTHLIKEKQYRTLACKKYLELSMRHGLPVKADWAACKYWEAKP
jgi:hypothetical protein